MRERRCSRPFRPPICSSSVRLPGGDIGRSHQFNNLRARHATTRSSFFQEYRQCPAASFHSRSTSRSPRRSASPVCHRNLSSLSHVTAVVSDTSPNRRRNSTTRSIGPPFRAALAPLHTAAPNTGPGAIASLLPTNNSSHAAALWPNKGSRRVGPSASHNLSAFGYANAAAPAWAPIPCATSKHTASPLMHPSNTRRMNASSIGHDVKWPPLLRCARTISIAPAALPSTSSSKAGSFAVRLPARSASGRHAQVAAIATTSLGARSSKSTSIPRSGTDSISRNILTGSPTGSRPRTSRARSIAHWRSAHTARSLLRTSTSRPDGIPALSADSVAESARRKLCVQPTASGFIDHHRHSAAAHPGLILSMASDNPARTAPIHHATWRPRA